MDVWCGLFTDLEYKAFVSRGSRLGNQTADWHYYFFLAKSIWPPARVMTCSLFGLTPCSIFYGLVSGFKSDIIASSISSWMSGISSCPIRQWRSKLVYMWHLHGPPNLQLICRQATCPVPSSKRDSGCRLVPQSWLAASSSIAFPALRSQLQSGGPHNVSPFQAFLDTSSNSWPPLWKTNNRVGTEGWSGAC